MRVGRACPAGACPAAWKRHPSGPLPVEYIIPQYICIQIIWENCSHFYGGVHGG